MSGRSADVTRRTTVLTTDLEKAGLTLTELGHLAQALYEMDRRACDAISDAADFTGVRNMHRELCLLRLEVRSVFLRKYLSQS